MSLHSFSVVLDQSADDDEVVVVQNVPAGELTMLHVDVPALDSGATALLYLEHPDDLSKAYNDTTRREFAKSSGNMSSNAGFQDLWPASGAGRFVHYCPQAGTGKHGVGVRIRTSGGQSSDKTFVVSLGVRR